MARSKKEPVEVVDEDLEALDETIDALEEELIEPELESLVEDDEEEEEKKAAPKAKRKPRARKAPARAKASAPKEEKRDEEKAPKKAAEVVDEVIVEEAPVISGTEILNATAKKKAQPKAEPATPVDSAQQAEHLREDAAIASAGLEKSMESMEKQWVSIQGISGSICTSLERVSEMMHEIPAQMEAMRPPTSRPAPITKIAVGMSGFAIVLSILSISFSQSVRQNVLSHEAAAKPAARIAGNRPAVTPPPVILKENENTAPAAPTPAPISAAAPAKVAIPAPAVAPVAAPKTEMAKALPKPPTAREAKRSDLKLQIEKAEAKLAAAHALAKLKKKPRSAKRRR